MANLSQVKQTKSLSMVGECIMDFRHIPERLRHFRSQTANRSWNFVKIDKTKERHTPRKSWRWIKG
jgi:hypothetical protein